MGTSAVHKGHCRCNKVQISVEGEQTLSVYCHCDDCRRATGAPVIASVGFMKHDVIWTSDATVKRHTVGTATRVFCENCGSPIAQEHESKSGMIFFNTGFMDEPEKFPPTYHSFAGEQISWLQLEDNLKRVEKTILIKTE